MFRTTFWHMLREVFFRPDEVCGQAVHKLCTEKSVLGILKVGNSCLLLCTMIVSNSCDTMTVSGVTHRSYFQRDLLISTVVTFGHPETGYYILFQIGTFVAFLT